MQGMFAGMSSELKLAVLGLPEEPPVLCLHGWLDNANSFDRLIPLLPEDFHYVAMGFGGHGLSSHYSPGFPYHHQNFEIRRVVAAFNLTKVSFLWGLCPPADSSLWCFLAVLLSELMDKLILLDVTPFILDTNEMENIPTYQRRTRENTLQVEASQKPLRVYSLEELFLKNNTHVDKECGELLLQRGTTKVATGKGLTVRLENTLEFVIRDMFVNFTRSLKGPVMNKVGHSDVRQENDSKKESVVFTVDTLKAILKEESVGSFVELPGNHYIHMSKPHLVASSIASFLQSKRMTLVSL
uniref:Serine hydrolase-like n=1 Tax=Nannospalax galili TaxID=1026970 RepID=A0A8C6QDY1_NANGA